LFERRTDVQLGPLQFLAAKRQYRSNCRDRARGAARRRRSVAANILPVIDSITAAGATSLDAIANALNARRVRTARGGRWHSTSVRNLVTRKRV
jgi:hypothetical protein